MYGGLNHTEKNISQRIWFELRAYTKKLEEPGNQDEESSDA